MNTILAKSVFPEDHPLALGSGGSAVTGMIDYFLSNADLICCIGASLSQTLAATAIPPGKTVIHCTQDEEDLNTEYRSAHAVVGDARLVLRQLLVEAKDRLGKSGAKGREDVAQEVRVVKEKWLQQWMPKLTSDEVPINPYRIVWDLAQTIDRNNAIITHDSGAPRGQLVAFYESLVPRSYIGWGNSHQLGSSLGLIMGAKLAAPNKLAVAYMGDAAFGMCGMDLETAVREQIPILAIVLNNSWMSGYREVIPVATERYKVGSLSGNYLKVAEGLGCFAQRVERPAEIIPAIQRAVKVTESGRPAVLEFITRVEEAGPKWGSPGPEGRMVQPSSMRQRQ
jgi:thiamine pyrophosphate-dependent acetolactate synthase large subunit-like protein